MVSKHLEKIRIGGRPLRVAMLTYSFYESDNRVRRYAEYLAKSGVKVDVFSLKAKGYEDYNQIKAVRIYRIQERVRDEKGKAAYLLRMLKFFLRSAVMLTKFHIKRSYDLVHVHSIPDFEVFAAVVPKLSGAKIILDIHDPVPDFFSAKFSYGDNSIYIRGLKAVERVCSYWADHVITVTDYWRYVIKQRSKIPEEKISTIVNYPDKEIFNPGEILATNSRKQLRNNLKILYPGTLNKHCGLHILLKAVEIARSSIPNIQLHIYGEGSEKKYLRLLAYQLNVDKFVFFHDSVPIDQVPSIMQDADIGVALLSGESNYSKQALNVKLFEFLAMGLPAIASRVGSILSYIGEELAVLSNQNDPKDVARCIIYLYENPEKRELLRNAGLKFIEKNSWQTQSEIYLKIIERLLFSKITMSA